MDLLSEVFSDLIKNINHWSINHDREDNKIEALTELKETLEEQIEEIDSEIRLLSQDSSWAGVDEEIERLKE